MLVDRECVSIRISTHRGKRLRFAFFPQHRQHRLFRWASGVSDRRLRLSYDLSAIIDIAGLSVISAQRRESAHIAVLPKKRATRKPCAEAANVFAVGIWNRCFGHADSFPAV